MVTVWVAIIYFTGSGLTIVDNLATKQDCQRIQASMQYAKVQCVQVQKKIR